MRSPEFTRGQLAKSVGCGAETIRFYETKGVLPEPRRAANGYRIYDSELQKRLLFVLQLRSLGFSIEEMRCFTDLLDREHTCGEVRAAMVEHLEIVAQKLNELREMEMRLRQLADQCEDGELPECPIIDTLMDTQLH